MIKVAPFIDTTGDKDFKEFLEQKFDINMISLVNESGKTLFADWRGKDMMKWFKFTNGDGVVLEFYPTYYTVNNGKPNSINYMMSVPETLNDFIDDLLRFKVVLYWTISIDEKFEPKQYLHADEIEGYYRDLLEKMGKSHELL